MSKNLSDIFPPTTIGGGGGGIEEAPKTGKLYARKDEAWQEFEAGDIEPGNTDRDTLVWSTADAEWMPSETVPAVTTGPNPPLNPKEGALWMEVPASGDAVMWVYDDGNGGQWLQHPGGKDGAPGKDGADGNIADGTQDGIVATWNDTTGQWTPDSSLTIDSLGNATFSGDLTISKQSPMSVYSEQGVYAWKSGMDINHNYVIDDFSGTPALSIAASTRDATFSGWAKAKTVLATFGGVNPVAGFAVAASDSIDTPALLPANASGAIDNAVDIGRQAFSGNQAFRWRNAHFSGTVSAIGIAMREGRIYGPTAGACGIYFDEVSTQIHPVDHTGARNNNAVDLGGPTHKFKDAHFSGKVSASNSFVTGNNIWREGHSGLAFGVNYIVPRDKDLNPRTSSVDIGQNSDRFKDGHFNGTVYSNGSPLTRTVDLIKTLTTLRNATKDETTLEGLRDAIGNAIGGLIEEFENQIATMEDEA